MAISFNALTGSSDTANISAYTTASITPGANRLVLAAILCSKTTGPADTPTLSGNGLTWVQEETLTLSGTSNTRLIVFRAMGASPSSGTVTIDFAGVNQTGCAWSICEFDGVDTGGSNGSAAVVQSQTNTASTGTSITVTLNAFASGSNATFGMFGHIASESTNVGTGFTSIHDLTYTGPSRSFKTEYNLAPDTSVDASWTTDSSNAGIGIEIAAAAGAAPTLVTRKPLLGVGL